MEGVKRWGPRKGAKYGEDGAVRRRKDEGEERENSTKVLINISFFKLTTMLKRFYAEKSTRELFFLWLAAGLPKIQYWTHLRKARGIIRMNSA